MKKIARLVAVLLCICMLFTSCAPVGTNGEKTADSEYSQEVQNLEKLCKVWGYTKYNHPAFLFGEKDWDEELLNLIPVVSEAKSDEVNDILHEWFVSLGEIDYGTSRPGSKPIESEAVVQADTNWILDEAYLGEALSADMQKMGPVPKIDRSKAPVKFSTGQSVPNFKMENTDAGCSYQTEEERLLGLFRVWNAIEYYFPYLDIMDESWHDLLNEFIPKILEASDVQSFELTICEMTAHLHDVHVGLIKSQPLNAVVGEYLAPVNMLRTEEGQWVVSDLRGDCPLQAGDVILKLDGTDIKEVEENRKKYVSVPNDEKLNNPLGVYLLRSKDEEMEITVLRDGKEETYSVKGTTEYTRMARKREKSHEILDGNIGLINPDSLSTGDTGTVVRQAMEDLRDTDGLIIDLRQYPSDTSMHSFLSTYLQKVGAVYNIMTVPSQSVPGTFIKQEMVSMGVIPASFYYEKPVVVLMDESSISNTEWSIMDLRTGDNVVVLGNTSLGTDGDITELPLPNGNGLCFTSCGIYTPEMGQTQRIGLSPDIEVYPTVEGIKEGRDELKEAAVAYIQEQNVK